jgi:hypothetical protein
MVTHHAGDDSWRGRLRAAAGLRQPCCGLDARPCRPPSFVGQPPARAIRAKTPPSP